MSPGASPCRKEIGSGRLLRRRLEACCPGALCRAAPVAGLLQVQGAYVLQQRGPLAPPGLLLGVPRCGGTRLSW